MKNAVALRNLCNAIANTFYPDKATIDLALFNEGIKAEAEATPKGVAASEQFAGSAHHHERGGSGAPRGGGESAHKGTGGRRRP